MREKKTNKKIENQFAFIHRLVVISQHVEHKTSDKQNSNSFESRHSRDNFADQRF